MRRSLVALVLAGVALAGCNGGGEKVAEPAATPAESESPQPQAQTEEAVREVAIEHGKRFAAQDFGGSWDLWAPQSQAAVSREDYIEFAKACDLGGMPLEVEDVRLEGDSAAVVRYGVAGFAQAVDFVYAEGRWGQIAEATEEAFEGNDVEGAIQAAKDQGRC